MLFSYNGWADRERIIKDQEALGLTMIRDDYASDWKHGDEPHGTMDFIRMPATPPDPPRHNWRAAWRAAGSDTTRLQVIARLLGLEE